MILDPRDQNQNDDQLDDQDITVDDTGSTGSAGGEATAEVDDTTEQTGSDESYTSDMDEMDYSEE